LSQKRRITPNPVFDNSNQANLIMLCIKLMILTIIFQMYPGITDVHTRLENNDLYNKGMLEKKDGQWKQALNTWFNARTRMLKTGDVDPRIGFAYIQLATKKHARKYFKSACIMYFWSLNVRNLNKYHKAIFKEIERIKPLLSLKEYHHFIKLWKHNNAEVLDKIRGFWIEHDPTPTTFVNERLLEHWERIAYVKEHFKKNNSTVYGTDDRGIIYVKYGSPSRKRRGTFVLDRSSIESWAREMLYKSGGRTSVDIDNNGGVNAMIRASQKDQEKIRYIVNTIRKYNNYNQYDIWVYNHLNNQNDNHVIFIFGRPGSGGSFGLIQSIDDLLDSSVYRQRRFPLDGQPFDIGIIMQLLYYQQIKHIDRYFSSAFLNLESSWVSNNLTADTYAAKHTYNEHRQEIQSRQRKAPDQKSTFDQQLPKIWITYKQARYLNDQNKPFSIIFVYSEPQKVLLKNYSVARLKKSRVNYYVKHNITLWNKHWYETSSANQLPEVHFMKSGYFNGPVPSQTIFKVNHKSKEQIHARVAVDAYNLNKKKSVNGDPFPSYLLGTGKEKITFKKPLNPDKNVLQMSDIVLGYRDSLLEQKNKVSGYDFYVPYKNIIPRNKDMRLHVEIYHLKEDLDGKTKYEIDYRIIPLNKHGKPVKKDSYVGLTLQYVSHTNEAKDNLQIDLHDIKEGRYQLKLKVSDDHSGESVSRIENFQKGE